MLVAQLRGFDVVISIHALHEESDALGTPAFSKSWRFQSTLSMRRATGGTLTYDVTGKFQSTLSMRRATDR